MAQADQPPGHLRADEGGAWRCAGVGVAPAANGGRVSFERVVAMCSANPAHIFGCTAKGSLAPGKDADIVLYDPEKDFTITQSKMHSDVDHTIWEGMKLHGYPVQTYSRGRLVYDNGEFTGEAGWGRLLKRVPRAVR